ncbi:MAG: hypothetical protein WCT10_05950 [Patescibacteria group bacterium]|jgi:hypothetical protein
MKFPGLKLNEIGRNRGGELKFVALLCLTTSFALSVALFTNTFLGRSDMLVRFAPLQTAIYLHANDGTRAAPWISQALALPENLKADEVARFAVANSDGSLSWGGLFRWNRWRTPTPTERELLRLVAATAIDERTFLVGDDRIIAEVFVAWGNGTTLAADQNAVRALSAARSLADFQAYANPARLPRDPEAADQHLFQGLPAFSLAVASADDRVRLTVVPLTATSNNAVWLGSSADAARVAKLGPELPTGAVIAVYGKNRDLDLQSLFFQKIDALMSLSPLADPTFATPSKAALGAIMTEFDALGIYASAADRPSFYAACSTCDLDLVAARIKAYANAAVPERRLVELPDEDTLTELVYSDQTVSWENLSDGTTTRSLSVDGNEIGLYLNEIDPKSGGVVLTNDLGLFALDRSVTRHANDSCSLKGVRTAVVKPELAEKALKVILGGSELSLNKAKSVVVAQIESGLLITCGYIGGNVDK